MKNRASALYFTSLQNCTKDASLPENRLPRDLHIFLMKITKLYIRGYSPFFPNLITKESYNWWVTRRVWGFRHKISKAKYLKMSVADIKYLKKNISKCRWQISGSFRRTPRHCAKWLQNSPGKCYRESRYVWPGKLKRPPLPSGVRRWMWDIRSEDPDMSDRGSWNVRRTKFFPRWNELWRVITTKKVLFDSS